MANRIFLLIILVVSLSSCDPIKKKIDERNYRIASEAARQKQEQDALERLKRREERLTSKEYLTKQALSTMRDAINQGYYVHYDYDGILSIFIEDENTVVVRDFNIIDGVEISNEITSFNLFYDNEIIHELHSEAPVYNAKYELYFINNDNIYNEFKFSTNSQGFWGNASFKLYNDNYVFYLSDAYTRRQHFFGTVNDKQYPLEFLSASKDENVIKYTYDYKKQYLENQKQYTGTYYYDSHIVYGDKEFFFNGLNFREQSLIINIDEKGLFLADESGNAIYDYDDLVYRTLIHDKNKETSFWGHSPAYGHETSIYYQNDTMNYTYLDSTYDGSGERIILSGYHVIYRKAGL